MIVISGVSKDIKLEVTYNNLDDLTTNELQDLFESNKYYELRNAMFLVSKVDSEINIPLFSIKTTSNGSYMIEKVAVLNDLQERETLISDILKLGPRRCEDENLVNETTTPAGSKFRFWKGNVVDILRCKTIDELVEIYKKQKSKLMS